MLAPPSLALFFLLTISTVYAARFRTNGSVAFISGLPRRIHIHTIAMTANKMSTTGESSSLSGDEEKYPNSNYGELERLKQEERRLASLLASIRQEKLSVLRSRPLSIGVVGFGRFGQFIAKKFVEHSNIVGPTPDSNPGLETKPNNGVGVVGKVVAISRTDYSDVASRMGVKFLPYGDMERFICDEDLDVIVLAVSILSFEETVKELAPILTKRLGQSTRGGAKDNATISSSTLPLIVDVLSVKEHPRNVLLQLLPEECDILCTHPMFGPDSARDSWRGQTFVFERTRIDKVLLGESGAKVNKSVRLDAENTDKEISFVDSQGTIRDVHENSNAHVEGMDRMERFLSIWEEEGCQMTPLSCKDHDTYASDSQFITHLMGRILGQQGLQPTPIDTRGFQSVLKLIENTNADSFDLFYGLYKFNRNSGDTIERLRDAMDTITRSLEEHKSD